MDNLEQMTVAELQDLRSRVDKAIASADSRKRKAALAAMEAVAKTHGFSSISEILESSPPKGRKTRRPAQFVNPNDASQTWSGRGRKPVWYSEALASGKNPDDLRI